MIQFYNSIHPVALYDIVSFAFSWKLEGKLRKNYKPRGGGGDKVDGN